MNRNAEFHNLRGKRDYSEFPILRTLSWCASGEHRHRQPLPFFRSRNLVIFPRLALKLLYIQDWNQTFDPLGYVYVKDSFVSILLKLGKTLEKAYIDKLQPFPQFMIGQVNRENYLQYPYLLCPIHCALLS